MANTIKVEIVSAEEEVWSGEGTMVFAPAEMGEIGIAPQHAPLLTRLKPGEIRVQQEAGDEQFFFVSGGLLEVQGHLVTVLSDTALRAGDLDEAAALEAQRRAEQAMSDRGSEVDFAKAKAELIQAAAQLRAIQKLRGKSRGKPPAPSATAGANRVSAGRGRQNRFGGLHHQGRVWKNRRAHRIAGLLSPRWR